MVTEDYVSFEIAKLLKEKGFDDCANSFLENGNMFPTCIVRRKEHYPAPTLQMAMKWLREVHGLHIDVFVGEDESYDADSVIVEQWHFWTYYITTTDGEFVYNAYEEFDVVEYQTHEEACEAAIKYCLEILI